jgi:hypothetical protein
MVPKEVQLLFDQLVQPHTQNNLRLRPCEMQHFTNCSEKTLIHALKSCSRWIQKRAADSIYISRNGIIKSVAESVNYNLRNVAPTPIVDRVEELLDAFAVNCTVESDWSLTTEDMQDLIAQYGASAVHDTMIRLGRFDVEHAAEAQDSLRFALELEQEVVR